MNAYEIVNRKSGHSFGVYQGETGDEAISAMMSDACSSDTVSDDIEAILVPTA